MKLIAVETSTPTFSVALLNGDRVTVDRQSDMPSGLLSDMIEKCTQKGGLALQELDGFAISIGPGSFTGLRVGVTTVKTLAWALNKPVLPVSSLEVAAAHFADKQKEIFMFLDARKKKVYAASFRPDGTGGIKRISEDQLLFPEDALKIPKKEAWVVGDGLKRYGELTGRSPQLIRTDEKDWVPQVENLCAIAAARWPTDLLDDPHQLVPKYLYSAESNITGW